MDAESSQMATAPIRKKRKYKANGGAAAGASTSSTEKPKRVRRKIGLLASLPSMPLDILFEILSHLKPYDVLRLARTTKDFRRLLLSKSSSSIWKAALRNVPGLPDCPPGMSEPAWTNLVFSPYCNYCLTTSIRKVHWIFRVRICSKCAKEHFGESRYSMESFLESVIPTFPGRKGAKIYLKSDRELIEDQYTELGTSEARRLFIEERRKTILAITQHAKLCEAWARDQTLDRDQQLQQLREGRLAAITQKLEDLGWAEDIAGISMPDSLANHKLVDRPQLLTERIWTNIKPGILEFMAEMREKRFKREFTALVNGRKHSALTVLRTFKNARLPETEIMPQGPDFCHFTVISEVLSQTAEVEVDVSSFNDIVPLLPQLVTEWQESIKQKLIPVVKMHNSGQRSRHRLSFLDSIFAMDGYMDEDEDEDETPLVGPYSHLNDEELSQKITLASTVFTCSRCGGYNDYHGLYYDSDEDEDYWSATLFYPQVMDHTCLVRAPRPPWGFFTTSDPSCRLESCSSERKQWDTSSLSLHSIASRTARHIIQLAEMDPDLATSHQMDQLKIRFGCRACALTVSRKSDDDGDNDSTFSVLDWRGAISHQTNRHPARDTDSIFMKITETDFSTDVKEAESEHWAKVDHIWLCTHCRDLPTEARADTLDGVEKHISRVHQIESPILNKDYFQHFAGPDLRNRDRFPFYVRYSGGRFCLYDEAPGLFPGSLSASAF